MSKKKTTQEFIIDAWCKHGDTYNYSLIKYINSKTKVKIICPLHGVFEQRPNNHLRGNCCPKCNKHKKSSIKKDSLSDFKQKGSDKHNNKYDYSLVEYIDSKTKVKIICPLHGVFEQIPSGHLRGRGCFKCALLKRKQSRINTRKTNNGFIQNAVSVHDNKYDYSLVEYIDSKTKVKIICPVHDVFKQRPNNHLCGQGCPKCISSYSISKGETELQEWLKGYINIQTSDRQIIKPLELDIVIPKHKIAIEYNGLYWHSEQQGKDRSYHLNKYNLCKEQGYRLITIWENEWLLKRDIVKSIILNALGIHTRKIHGRKCIIKDVLPKEARIMYDNNHIQGFKGGKHKGLYYKDELVSLMSIDKRNELQRFVNIKNTLVHGAFSKLLKSFDIKGVLFTFADTRYFTGNVYTKNGFGYVYTSPPNYWYFKKMNVYSRIMFQKHKLKDKLKSFDISITEYQNMINNGYNRIWDNGNRKYIMENKNG